MSVVDYYAVLGLKPGATIVQVKAQFRRLAMAVHPDRNSDDSECQERLKNINAAYEFLSDASRKADYDARGSAYAETGPTQIHPAAPPVPPGHALQASRPARLLTLIALWVFLAGVIVAAVLLAGSAQSADGPGLSPAVTVIELPSTDDAAASASGEGATAFAVPSSAAGPEAWAAPLPDHGQTFWPGVSPGPPPDPNAVAPVSDPNPLTAGAIPVQSSLSTY